MMSHILSRTSYLSKMMCSSNAMMRQRLIANRTIFTHGRHLLANCDSCWSCGTEIEKMNLFCKAPKCGVVQSIKTTEVNLFETFGINMEYKIDEALLDKSFKELQKKLHPDKFATKSVDEQKVSTNASTAINMAYQVLTVSHCYLSLLL